MGGHFGSALVLGVTDGLLNALTLAASSLVGSGAPVTVNLAIRVGVAAVVTAAFTMAVADYAERRTKLVRAGQQLNLTSRGRLATTLLGRRAAGESLRVVLVIAVLVDDSIGVVRPGILRRPRWGRFEAVADDLR